MPNLLNSDRKRLSFRSSTITLREVILDSPGMREDGLPTPQGSKDFAACGERGVVGTGSGGLSTPAEVAMPQYDLTRTGRSVRDATLGAHTAQLQLRDVQPEQPRH